MSRPSAVDLEAFVLQAHEVQLARLPLGPTMAELNGISLAQARYYLRSARDKGLLVDLRHSPTEATIFRNAAGEHSWLVCRTCLTPWPCQVVEHRYSEDVASPS